MQSNHSGLLLQGLISAVEVRRGWIEGRSLYYRPLKVRLSGKLCGFFECWSSVGLLKYSTWNSNFKWLLNSVDHSWKSSWSADKLAKHYADIPFQLTVFWWSPNYIRSRIWANSRICVIYVFYSVLLWTVRPIIYLIIEGDATETTYDSRQTPNCQYHEHPAADRWLAIWMSHICLPTTSFALLIFKDQTPPLIAISPQIFPNHSCQPGHYQTAVNY